MWAALLVVVVGAQGRDGGVVAPRAVREAGALSAKSLEAKSLEAKSAEARDGGVRLSSTPSDEGSTKRELAELRAKVTELEAKLQRLEGLEAKVEALTEQAKAEQARREQAERVVTEQRAAAQQAGSTLSLALQSLASGSTQNVDGWLLSAQRQLEGTPQRLVAGAREALAQKDLTTARQLLGLALLEAQATPPQR